MHPAIARILSRLDARDLPPAPDLPPELGALVSALRLEPDGVRAGRWTLGPGVEPWDPGRLRLGRDGRGRALVVRIRDGAVSVVDPDYGSATDEGPLGSWLDLQLALQETWTDADFDRLAAPVAATIGPYLLEDRLGAGGMGVVWRARHQGSGQRVALKTLGLHGGEARSLRREIRALARIRHPGVVRILNQGTDEGGRPWYAMELVEGATLGAWAEGRPLRDLLDVVRRLCLALAWIHGEGLVHGDLKPANVLVRPDGSPVLVDFGVALRFAGWASREPLQVGGVATGTVAYMAPERIRSEIVDARADLYALGCVLVELLTGLPPFATGTPASVLQDHLTTPPLPPSATTPGISPQLDALALGLLAKDPTSRIGHVDVVAERLVELGASPEPAAALGRRCLYRAPLAGAPLRDVTDGLLLVGGRSGVGKTRQVTELASRLRAGGARLLSGECTPEARHAPLHAFRPTLAAVGDLVRERGLPPSLAAPLGVLAALEPALSHPDLAEPPALPPASARQRLVAAAVAALRWLASQGPLALVLDDLQWADDLTLTLVEHLHRIDLLGPGFTLLGTWRTEEQGAALDRLLGAVADHTVRLGRLDEQALQDVAAGLLGLQSAPALEPLVARAEGSPFFLAEIVHAAAETGILRHEAGRWRVAGDASMLPASIEALVAWRLGRLDTDTRTVVEAASVLGRDVPSDALARVARVEEAALIDATSALVTHRFLDDRGAHLRFVHDRVREVVMSTVEPARRRHLHRRAAQVLDEPAVTAWHWQEAGEPERARADWLLAARQAARGYAGAQAEPLFRNALALFAGPCAEAVAVRNALAHDVLAVVGRAEDALAEHEAALAQARAIGDRDGECQALSGLAAIRADLGLPEEAVDLARQALALASGAGARGKALETLSLALYNVGQVDEAGRAGQEALDLLRAAGDTVGEGVAAYRLGFVHTTQGRPEEAQALYDRALALFRQADARRWEGVTLVHVGVQAFHVGRLDEAAALGTAARELLRAVGDPHWEAAALNNLAELSQARGDLKAAAAMYAEALGLARSAGGRHFASAINHNLGEVEALLGRTASARRRFEAALREYRALGELRFEPYTLYALADLDRWEDRLDEAERGYLAAEEGFGALGARGFVGVVRCRRGHLAIARGQDGAPFLGDARAIAAETDSGPQSPLGQAVARLERALACPDGCRHGEHPGDLPGVTLAG